MTDHGKIVSYDTGNGTGTIAPKQGGAALPFCKAALAQQGPEPTRDQHYSYDVKSAENGKHYADNLQLEGDAIIPPAPTRVRHG